MSIEYNTIIGVIAGVLTSAALIPQLLKAIKHKRLHEFSSPTLLLLFLGNGLWVYYGVLISDWPVILTNLFSVLLNCTIVIFRYAHKNDYENYSYGK
jgi:MtN3 and saliva related transmembrane protein